MPNITLISADGEEFKIERKIAECSVLIKNFIEDLGDNEIIPVGGVKSNILKKVIEWCDHHQDDKPPVEDERDKKLAEVGEWDQKFFQLDQKMLFEIILAANYLNIKKLLDAGCKTVANMMKGKTAEQLRETFNVHNDFTPAEEAAIIEENKWAEDV